MYQRILVATDLAQKADETIRKGWELANQFDAQIHLIHVIEPIPAYGYEGITQIESPYIEQARNDLEEVAKEYTIPVENCSVLIGPIKAVVLDRATELNADLIIVGSHGRHGIARLLGSTANAILHGAECDVMTVRKSA